MGKLMAGIVTILMVVVFYTLLLDSIVNKLQTINGFTNENLPSGVVAV